MGATVRWEGLSELRAALRRLPGELASEGADIVEAAANGAFATIGSGYPSRSGNLRRKLKVTHTRSRFGARSTVRNTAAHALAFDIGSQTVRVTKKGVSRGRMPAKPIFSETAARARRRMHDQHRALLERNGLKVSGDV